MGAEKKEEKPETQNAQVITNVKTQLKQDFGKPNQFVIEGAVKVDGQSKLTTSDLKVSQKQPEEEQKPEPHFNFANVAKSQAQAEQLKVDSGKQVQPAAEDKISSIFGSVAKPGQKPGFGGAQAPKIDYDALMAQEAKKQAKPAPKPVAPV